MFRLGRLGPTVRAGRPRRASRAGFSALLYLACVLPAASSTGDLALLAAVDAAAGDEGRLVSMIADRVGGRQRFGRDGSLVLEFGPGAPTTLIVTAGDEPGLVVSGIDAEGYLRVQPLASGRGAEAMARHFAGQHVRISTHSEGILAGVIAAPSVHFRSGGHLRGQDLFVDVGAASSAEAKLAGLGVLDRVTLEKRVAPLAGGWLSSPWISSRVGPTVLLGLAERLAGVELDSGVALAIASQQEAGNSGLTRVVNSLQPSTLVLLAPARGRAATVAPCSGRAESEALARRLSNIAGSFGLEVSWRSSHALSLGPFSAGEAWSAESACAVLSPGARHAGSAAEAVQPAQVAKFTDVLAAAIGARVGPGRPKTGAAPAATAALKRPPKTLDERLERLLSVAGVSGNEGPVRDLIRSWLPEYAAGRAEADGAGNLVVRIGRDGAPAAAFVAHMDEIGLRVTSVLANGSLTAVPVGGGIQRLFAGHPSLILGESGAVHSVMPAERTLDIGASSSAEVESAGVRPGATATAFRRYRRLLGSRVSGRSLDDRIGCALLLEALGRLRGAALRARRSVDFVFSAKEEAGLQGARHYADEHMPVHVYAIDTFVTSDSPLESRHMAFARLGSGAVVRAVDQSGLAPRAEVDRIVRIARRNSIPVQVGVTAGGNDGSVFRSLDSASVPIGFPLRYAHAPVEVADLRDAAALADLVEVLAREALASR
ncbi:MAG: M20/M25/M40 family metallo-hydrolase [Bryobacterales bacterium]|nr:M20/M25/M40 family metallo-hydrolase [Bryobacterales bacterium]